MRLPFLGRARERARLHRALTAQDGHLVCLTGRRRLGKSRLLQEVLRDLPHVYVVGDDEDPALQIAAVAREVARLLPGFDAVTYPSWDALLERWWVQAPPGAILALDEFQAFVAATPALPSVLQRRMDRAGRPARHVALCGSSQRMMLGLLLDATAPLYGRAREILHLGPLEVGLLPQALGLAEAGAVVDAWATWGGVPRYWELAADYGDHWEAIAELALDPSGVLHHEPRRLLLDDLRETARAASVLALVGQGCTRISEIGARLGQPATSLTRPLARLQELGLLRRDAPWEAPERGNKRTAYRIADSFLAFWYRFVEPARSRLGAGQVEGVLADVRAQWPVHVGGVWEDLVREAVARGAVLAEPWLPPCRWWGPGTDRAPLELDLVTRHAVEPTRVLVGEVKRHLRPVEVPRVLHELEQKAQRCPALSGARVEVRLWVLDGCPVGIPGVVTGAEALGLSAS